MTDSMVMAVILAVFALLFGFVAYTLLRQYARVNTVLKREKEMQDSCRATVVELVEVRRSNQTFRWKNQYPILSYEVDGKEYRCKADFAEKRKGQYFVGEQYDIRYVREEPEVAIITEFLPIMKRTRIINMIVGALFTLFTFNLITGIIQVLLFGVEAVM